MPNKNFNYFNLNYWLNIHTRIGRIELIFKLIVICILIVSTTFIIQFFIIARYGEAFLPINFIFLILYWALIISAFKTRYNDLPPLKYAFVFFVFRCFFSRGDQWHNKHGNPPQPFSSKIFSFTLLLYAVFTVFYNYLTSGT